jgi:hypothetical protein
MWMSFAARSVTDKVMVVVPPIAAFVAAGFEHSIANLYLLPYGLAIKAWAGPEFWAAIGQDAAAYPVPTASGAFHNIVVATIGNLVGGSLMVGAVYWFVYLRRRAQRNPGSILPQSQFINRQILYLRPDPARVVVRPFRRSTEPRDFSPTDKTRANHIVSRILQLDAEAAAKQLSEVLENFEGRHRICLISSRRALRIWSRLWSRTRN